MIGETGEARRMYDFNLNPLNNYINPLTSQRIIVFFFSYSKHQETFDS